MRFLVDAQLPPALASWLAEAGHEANHVAAVGLLTASDRDIWQHCLANGAVLLTKDEDFLGIRVRAGSGPAVCWLRIGNATRARLIVWFEARLAKVVAAIEAGETIIEVR